MKNFSSKQFFIVILMIMSFYNTAFTQTGVRIAGSAGTADPSSMLDVISNSKGVLIPRMLESERTSISSPATGLIVYQTNNSKGIYYFDGAVWVQLAAGALSGSGANNYLARWSGGGLTTGASYDDGTNVGIGNTGPSQKLDVSGNIRATGMIIANANGAPYLQGGDDATLNDVNVANTVGVIGLNDATKGSIQLGNNNAQFISGSGGNIGIGTTGPQDKLHVNGTARVTSLAGTGNRAVYADVNGTLKAATKNIAYVVSNAPQTVTKCSTLDVLCPTTAVTTQLSVETGDVVSINSTFHWRFAAGSSGGDQPKFGLRVTGASGGCGTAVIQDFIDNQQYEIADNIQREYSLFAKNMVWVSTCTGTITVTLGEDFIGTDDAGLFSDIVITATRY